jgi:hypothetical protein
MGIEDVGPSFFERCLDLVEQLMAIYGMLPDRVSPADAHIDDEDTVILDCGTIVMAYERVWVELPSEPGIEVTAVNGEDGTFALAKRKKRTSGLAFP